MDDFAGARIAVILPCYNEEAAIAGVVKDFRAALPSADIYVYDNASSDETSRVASEAGAIVRLERARGKGNAVRRAFADVDADVFIMADGDGTYDASAAPAMVAQLLRERLDMIVGIRAHDSDAAYRAGHVFGNRMFSLVFRRLFRSDFTDILSGYRVFSRRFVKSFPLGAKGFEIEIEMCAHAALMRLPTLEVETAYGERPDGSESKLNTYRDGARILRRMFRFLRLHRPRFVYGWLAIFTAAIGVILAVPVVYEYFQTGLVPRFPTLIVAVGFMLAAVIFFVLGAILDAQAQNFAETKRLSYLRIAPFSPTSDDPQL
ncbi:MAG: glycosyltransferase [Pseudomonadota bacterium]